MGRVNDYAFLHGIIIVFSLTGVFEKLAANAYNAEGLWNIQLYVFLFLMLLVCAFYAFFWQKVIKRFDLSIAYANRSVYLIWSQLWAVFLFGEEVTVRNIIGMLTVMCGVVIVAFFSDNTEEEQGK